MRTSRKENCWFVDFLAPKSAPDMRDQQNWRAKQELEWKQHPCRSKISEIDYRNTQNGRKPIGEHIFRLMLSCVVEIKLVFRRSDCERKQVPLHIPSPHISAACSAPYTHRCIGCFSAIVFHSVAKWICVHINTEQSIKQHHRLIYHRVLHGCVTQPVFRTQPLFAQPYIRSLQEITCKLSPAGQIRPKNALN